MKRAEMGHVERSTAALNYTHARQYGSPHALVELPEPDGMSADVDTIERPYWLLSNGDRLFAGDAGSLIYESDGDDDEDVLQAMRHDALAMLAACGEPARGHLGAADFAILLTPSEWEQELGVKVRDPDGWRVDGKSWDEPIAEYEFQQRAAQSLCEARRKHEEQQQ